VYEFLTHPVSLLTLACAGSTLLFGAVAYGIPALVGLFESRRRRDGR
jgi:hypothetical protein